MEITDYAFLICLISDLIDLEFAIRSVNAIEYSSKT